MQETPHSGQNLACFAIFCPHSLQNLDNVPAAAVAFEEVDEKTVVVVIGAIIPSPK